MSKFLCIVFFIFLITKMDCYKDENLKDTRNNPWHGLPMICSIEDPKNVSISCHGVRIIKRVIQQLLDTAVESSSIEITDGITLIKNKHYNVRNSRTIKDSIVNFFEGIELKLKLQSLLPSNIESSIVESIPTGRGKGGGFGAGLPGLGGGKKGDNNFLILAIMMGKMLGLMSFGALAVVAMKALGVSLLALVLSLVAARKYTESTPKSDASEHLRVYATPQEPNSPERRSGNNLAYRGHEDTHGSQEPAQYGNSRNK